MEENVGSNLQENKDKAKHAADMLKKLNNKKNILSLAGICDIYSQFSQMVCELQIVNVLPFERYAQYQRQFNKMRKMLETINDHSKCDVKECLWGKYHNDKTNILNGKFGSVLFLMY